MFEQAFKNIDDVLWKEAGCTTELDYTEQTSWLLFLKYLDGLEREKAMEAQLDGKKYSHILDKEYRWETWAAPRTKDGAMAPQTREVRATNAKVYINTRFSAKQQVFLDFVLSHYVSVGVEELSQEKLTSLLRLKYNNSIADAVADLGNPEEIGKVFAGFQKYLYQACS